MSLLVPQNGVKADSEPVIELFVKVRPKRRSHGRSFFVLVDFVKPILTHCDDTGFISALEKGEKSFAILIQISIFFS